MLHTDYRNHAGSDDDDRGAPDEVGLHRGRDQRGPGREESSLPLLDGDRVGLLGRSMGGGVTLQRPGGPAGPCRRGHCVRVRQLEAIDNFDQWIRDDPGRSALGDYILDRWGEPGENPAFLEGVSP